MNINTWAKIIDEWHVKAFPWAKSADVARKAKSEVFEVDYAVHASMPFKGELPALRPTKIVGKGTVYVDRRGIKHGSDFIMRAKVGYSPLMLLPKTSERWKIRSRTFQGIGDAFANQWTLATRPNQ